MKTNLFSKTLSLAILPCANVFLLAQTSFNYNRINYNVIDAKNTNVINISNLTVGNYILITTDEKGNKASQKLIKKIDF